MNRIIIDNASTKSDYTRELNNYHAKTVMIKDAGKTIYISSLFKFNHIYFDLNTVSSTPLTINVSLYNGTTFNSVADKIDETYGMTQSGFLTWTPNDICDWVNADTQNIADLATFKIYKNFWLKIDMPDAITAADQAAWVRADYDAVLTIRIQDREEDPAYSPSEEELDAEFILYKSETITDLDIKWVGNIFSTDADLNDEFHDLASAEMYTALNTSTHITKNIRAAQVIIGEMRTKNLISNPGNIIERRDLMPASVQKVAELIFNELGEAYKDQKEIARRDFYERLKKLDIALDLNNDGVEDVADRMNSIGYLYR